MGIWNEILARAAKPYQPPVDERVRQTLTAKNDQISSIHYHKITSFWDDWDARRAFKVNDYVNLQGTLPQYVPMIVRNPKGKIKFHREFRRDAGRKKVRDPFALDVALAYTAGQMIWRPKLDLEYEPLGLYQSIVRNSIPIYVDKNYYLKEVKKLFPKDNHLIDVELQGKIVQIRDTQPICGIAVNGMNKTWIRNPEESKYLDGDIWIALEYKNKERATSRFLDLSDPEYFKKEREELDKDVEKQYPKPTIIHEFDQETPHNLGKQSMESADISLLAKKIVKWDDSSTRKAFTSLI